MLVELAEYTQLSNLSPQHAYVDEFASLKTASWTVESGDFNWGSFAELCNLLEAIVLHDQLLTAPTSYMVDPASVDIVSPFLNTLVSEGVLTYVRPVTHLLFKDAPNTQATRDYRQAINSFENAKKGVIHIEHINGVGLATVHAVQLHPSVSNANAYYETLRLDTALDATSALLEAYRTMTKSLSSDLQELVACRGRLTVTIPPIPIEILKRVSRPSEIVEEALHLRDRFRNVRRAYADYAAVIRDPTERIDKSLSAMLKLRQVLHELSVPFGGGERRQILEWSSLGDLAGSGSELATGEVGGLLKVVLGKPVEWVVHWLSRRRFIQLYRLRKQALKTMGYEQQIDRLWGEAARRCGESPEKLHDLVDYPPGSDWRAYRSDDVRLWSWGGQYIGYRKGNALFVGEDKHVGRFVENDVYGLDGKYWGELRQGRLVRKPTKKHKRVAAIQEEECSGGRPCPCGPLESWDVPDGYEAFPSLSN